MSSIPELQRLPDSWIRTSTHRVINGRDEIAKSVFRICELDRLQNNCVLFEFAGALCYICDIPLSQAVN
jgi:hypothetical protein